MFKKILILLLVIKHTKQIKNINTTCDNHLLINKIIEKYFDTINCVSYIDLSNFDQFFYIAQPKFIKKINISVITPIHNLTTRPRRDIYDVKKTIQKSCPENGQGFLLQTRSINDLQIYMSIQNVTPFWSPQALIFIHIIQKYTETQILETSRNLFRVYKTPHLVYSGCDVDDVLFFNPFVYDGESKKWGRVFRYDFQTVLNDSRVIKHNLWDLNGYPLIQVIFRSPLSIPVGNKKYVGLDLEMLDVIQKFINFKSIIIEPHDDMQYGFKLPDGTFTGALRRLLDGDADYINVNYFVTDYLTRDFEFSVSTMSDSLCVIMRKAEKVPDWQLLYYCFDHRIWIGLSITYFIMSISWKMIQRILVTFNEKSVMYRCVFLDTFRLMITSSLFRLPSITSERVFLSTCLVAFVTIVGAFQGSLVGVYSAQLFYKDIDTLEELSWTETQIKSGFMFIIGEVFTDVTNPKILRLKNMLGFYNDTVPITKRVAEQHFFATLVRQSEFDLDKATTTYFDSEGNNLIHMVRECARSYNLAYPLPVNSYLAPRLNDVLLRIAEAGLPVKWYTEMAFEVSRLKRQSSVTDGFKVFGLKDMQIAFLISIIGNTVGIIVFIIEIVVNIRK